MDDALGLGYFSDLEDPRIVGMVTYPLDEVLLVVLSGVLCGFDDFEELVFWAESELPWFQTILSFSAGIPTAITIRRVLNALDSTAFARCFERWILKCAGIVQGVIAVDGKTVRGSHHRADGGKPTHLVSAFSYEKGLVIAQEEVDQKSNEITAIPKILNRLSLPGTIVTLDAMGTQKEIARQIIEAGGDYILAVKGNQKTLKEEIIRTLNIRSKCWDEKETIDAGHGRIDVRLCRVTSDIDRLKRSHPDWVGIKSVVQITSKRIDKKTGHVVEKERYYITSLEQNAEKILEYVRAHWSIENTLHWVLDVHFREDSCRMRTDHGAANLAIIRKMAFNLFKALGEKKTMKRHMTTALIDQQYRTKILAQNQTVNNL